MKRFELGVFCFALGCAASDGEEAPLTNVQRMELAELGVSHVSVEEDHFVLADRTGAQIGDVRFEGVGTVVSTFGAHQARITTTSTGDASVTCDGQSLVLADGYVSTSGDVGAALRPCDAARRVASILIGNVHPSPAVQSQLLAACSDVQLAYVDGCVSWNAGQGCTLMQYCAVQWCPDGSWSDYQCSIE